MCEYGTTYELPIEGKLVTVDACLAPLIAALNLGGYPTVASCCGHGHRPGNIALKDGRELCILPDYETGRRMDRTFGLDIHGQQVGSWRGEVCKRCLRRNTVGFHVPEEVWAAVSRGRWNILCLSCFDEEAEAASVRYELGEVWPVTWASHLNEPYHSWSDLPEPGSTVEAFLWKAWRAVKLAWVRHGIACVYAPRTAYIQRPDQLRPFLGPEVEE